jgi:hypothetical protein
MFYTRSKIFLQNRVVAHPVNNSSLYKVCSFIILFTRACQWFSYLATWIQFITARPISVRQIVLVYHQHLRLPSVFRFHIFQTSLCKCTYDLSTFTTQLIPTLFFTSTIFIALIIHSILTDSKALCCQVS